MVVNHVFYTCWKCQSMEGVLNKCGKMCLKLCGICKGGQQTKLGLNAQFSIRVVVARDLIGLKQTLCCYGKI
jgi:hypothetical protein